MPTDGGIDSHEYLGPPLGCIFGLSAISAVDIVTTPTSDAGTFPLPYLPLVDEGRISSWLQEFPQTSHSPQPVAAGPNPSPWVHPSPIRAVDGTWHPETLTTATGVYEGPNDAPTGIVHPSEYTYPGRTSFPQLTLSTSAALACGTPQDSLLEGSEGFGRWPTLSILNEGPTYMGLPDADTTRDLGRLYQGGAHTSHQDHQRTYIEPTSNLSAPSALQVPATPSTLAIAGAQHPEQGTPRYQSQPLQRAGQGATATSSRLLRQPAGTHEAPSRRYPCTICGKRYSQPQGVARHRRERHNARLCMHCGVYGWARPYRLKQHIEKRHPGVDPDAALEEATGTRRKATIITRYLPQELVFPLTFGCDGQGGGESQLYPPAVTTPPLAVRPPPPARLLACSVAPRLRIGSAARVSRANDQEEKA